MNTNDQLLFKIATQRWKRIEQQIFFPIFGGMHNLMYSVDYTVTLMASNGLSEFLKHMLEVVISGLKKIIQRKNVRQNTHPYGFVLKKFCKIQCKANCLPASIVMIHSVKSVRIRKYSGPHFPAGKCGSESRRMQTDS